MADVLEIGFSPRVAVVNFVLTEWRFYNQLGTVLQRTLLLCGVQFRGNDYNLGTTNVTDVSSVLRGVCCDTSFKHKRAHAPTVLSSAGFLRRCFDLQRDSSL